jgi:quercetin dioxygenase-like cupin family protein
MVTKKMPEGAAPETGAKDLAGLVAYQAGAVVSKEVARKPKGTITVFAFDRGQGLSEHTAPFDAFVQVLDGTARITVGGTPHAVRAGGFLVMPAGVPHALHAVEPFKMLLVMIRS